MHVRFMCVTDNMVMGLWDTYSFAKKLDLEIDIRE